MKKTVLVVDDDNAVRESMSKVLREAGYGVVLAAGGLEALLRFNLDPIDVLLLDLKLPNQNGWDVFEHLTRIKPWIPVILITGLPNQYPTALAAGASALFEKPIDVNELLTSMERLLAEPKELRLKRLCGHLADTRFGPPAEVADLGRSPKFAGLRSAERCSLPDSSPEPRP